MIQNCHNYSKKKLLLRKILHIKKFCSYLKKVCFYLNKVYSHMERICLHIQKAHSKFLWQWLCKILVTIYHGYFLWEIPMTNPQLMSNVMQRTFYVGESPHLFDISKIILSWKWLMLIVFIVQLPSYHPEKALIIDLVCLFVIKTKQRKYEHDETYLSSDCLKNVDYFLNSFMHATTRHGVTRKRSTKRLKHAGNLFRKNL